MALDPIFKLDSIAEIEGYLRSIGPDRARPHLIEAFFKLVEYRNAHEWNRLVRVCEALAIAGWGNYEPVEATAERWINGSFYTELRNRFFEDRFLSVGWKKKGTTFVHEESSRFYYRSPDCPERPELNTSEYLTRNPDIDNADYGVSALHSQRNPLPKNPIRLTRSGNYYPVFEPFVTWLRELRHRLDRETRPELYGSGFGYIGLRCDFSDKWCDLFHSKSDIPPGFEGRPYVRERIEYGRLSVKQSELKMAATRHFPSDFGNLSLDEQAGRFGKDLLDILSVLAQRLQQKKLDYDTGLLIEDCRSILADITRKGPSRAVKRTKRVKSAKSKDPAVRKGTKAKKKTAKKLVRKK